MNKKNKHIYGFVGILIILFISLIGFRILQEDQPDIYDEFAQCIADSGATFYGAYWCPHCNEQKEMFGNSAQYLPYVECSTPTGSGQTDECIAADIESYPTWIFADGSRLSGALPLETLSEKTDCALDGSYIKARTATSTTTESNSKTSEIYTSDPTN